MQGRAGLAGLMVLFDLGHLDGPEDVPPSGVHFLRYQRQVDDNRRREHKSPAPPVCGILLVVDVDVILDVGDAWSGPDGGQSLVVFGPGVHAPLDRHSSV